MVATPEHVAFLLAIGVATGVAGAVLGTGGGVFLIPLLVLALGLPMHIAVGTSILSVVATSTAVAAVNVERGTANMRLGMTLEIARRSGRLRGPDRRLAAGPRARDPFRGRFAADGRPDVARENRE